VALDPVRRDFTPAQWRRVRAALALTLSIDAIVVMKGRLPARRRRGARCAALGGCGAAARSARFD
jgi:hypothetical protein